MTLKEFEIYYTNIDMFQAQELLLAFQASDYPGLKQEARERVYKQTRKQAYPFEKQKIITFDDLERLF